MSAAAGVAVICIGAGALWIRSAQLLGARYAVETPPLVIPSDSVAVARGEHLAHAALSCTLCHGQDLGGAVYMDAGAIGIVAGPNLTSGAGGIGASREDIDLIRALRFGVRQDSTSLLMMPSEVFVHLTDEDLAAVIAYVRHAPPVDRIVPRSRFGLAGRALLALGQLNLLVASKTPRLTPVASVSRTPGPAYGRYLADISGCHGCHGFGLSGGKVAGPPGLPPASNLTPGAIPNWQESDFVRVMRDGRRRDNSPVNEFMPWKTFRGMTDDELHALWLYLQSVPPRAFGNK